MVVAASDALLDRVWVVARQQDAFQKALDQLSADCLRPCNMTCWPHNGRLYLHHPDVPGDTIRALEAMIFT